MQQLAFQWQSNSETVTSNKWTSWHIQFDYRTLLNFMQYEKKYMIYIYIYCTTCKFIKRAIQIKSLWIFCSSSHDALKWFLSKPKLKPRIKHLPHQCLWKAQQCFKSIFWLFVLKHSLLWCQTNTWKYNHSQSILLLKYTIIHMFAHVATQAFSKCVTAHTLSHHF